MPKSQELIEVFISNPTASNRDALATALYDELPSIIGYLCQRNSWFLDEDEVLEITVRVMKHVIEQEMYDANRSKLATYLTNLSHSRIIDLLRQKERSPEISYESDFEVSEVDDEDGIPQSTIDSISDHRQFDEWQRAPSDPQSRVEAVEMIEQMEEHLSDLEYKVFELMLDGYKEAEIANQLDMTSKQVNNTILRVREKCRDHWDV